ncbi:tRNA (guanosine(46)-N7)-methyltransferase TrmB [Nocardia transvalensis]|uniref:tRNA (guanosine(46)-N7)-methyltransferase TrmB n=1 Tax=Nocardia transvalensis TaxID=37333 RepID=UPI0018961F16|nr:tRNA (guanosine(46)-N7)-methyltransferase TrmB [Nocardia transvalensis]MBF6328968.1 tRNA (guanosine(46)-N7)-methyltransferase TrmB [Nocardia transvalensis]
MDAVNDAANHTAESVPGPRSTASLSVDGAPGRGGRGVTGSRLYPRVTSFRSRRGALTATQQQAWERTWPRIGREVSDEPLDATAWFGREAPLIVEIGCGTGTATAAMAQAEPQFNLIGIEVYKPGLAQLVQRIEREGIDNIRLLRGDAVDVLEHMVAENSLTGVRVFFPDPWPKARHHKRRLLQPHTMSLIASRLKSGGVLHVATDHAGYAEHIAEVGAAEPQFIGMNKATGGDPDAFRDSAPIGFERPVTKFESKAHRAGSAITEFIWGKIES